METIHIHRDPKKHNLNVLLLLIPPALFVAILFIYLISKTNKPFKIAVESSPEIGTETNNTNFSVLGDQDNLDISNPDLLE